MGEGWGSFVRTKNLTTPQVAGSSGSKGCVTGCGNAESGREDLRSTRIVRVAGCGDSGTATGIAAAFGLPGPAFPPSLGCARSVCWVLRVTGPLLVLLRAESRQLMECSVVSTRDSRLSTRDFLLAFLPTLVIGVVVTVLGLRVGLFFKQFTEVAVLAACGLEVEHDVLD